MNTEVETVESAATEIPNAAPVAPAPSSSRSPLWRRRRYQLAAGITVVAILSAFIANNLLARQYTPEGAVRQYLSALQGGDVSGAWSEIQVSAPTAQAAFNLTDRAALQAALSTRKPDIKSFALTSTTNSNPSTAIVDFSYDTAAGSKQGKFVVQRSGETHFGLYPDWHVVISPTLLTIALPKGSNGVSIDGRAIALPDGKSTVAVLPLSHRVQFTGTQMLTSQTVSLESFLSLAQGVPYQPILNAAGIAQAKAAVKAAIDTCAKRTQANLDDGTCPQGLSYGSSSSGQWNLIGDPTQDLNVAFDQDLNAVGSGHFQMVFGFQEQGWTGTRQTPSAGGYKASLTLSTSSLTVANIQRAEGLPTLVRPAGATDQAAKDLVSKGFMQCASVSAEFVADCPQAAPDAIITDVHWSLEGDPLAGATVNFDPDTGLLTVHGNFSMAVSYKWFGNFARSGHSYIKAYDAHLFWDGQGLQLVNIDGAVS